ncbi:nectin-1-like isoform X1 [Electrophorus electricus]|uniref:Ig-like domain-containing protein n=1 Tax=Electrophorus electricus TaxID=8005 RepID=A0AAY5ESV8_ELEEL|nr:nectin-1-like isoform X1 [Electrophorus electricus]
MMYFQTYLLLHIVVSTLRHGRITAVRVIGRSVTIQEGGSATLFCQLIDTEEELTQITWQKRTRGKPENRNFFVISPDGITEHINGLKDRIDFIGNMQECVGSIALKNVSLLDEGIYTCIFNIFPSGPFGTEIKLTVLVPPVVSVGPVIIPVAGDGNVTLATCTAAKTRPAAEVSWLLALNTSVRVETSLSLQTDGTYTVTSHLIGVASKELNQQKVHCLVNHMALHTELVLDYTIVIHYPPQVAYILSVGKATKHQEFLCEADGNPKPTTFTWRRVNIQVDDKDKLLIPLSSDHNGLYVCEASNQYGSVTGSLYVYVNRESTWTTVVILGIILVTILLFLLYFFRKRLFTHLVQLWRGIHHVDRDRDRVPTQSPSQNTRSERTEEQQLGACYTPGLL